MDEDKNKLHHTLSDEMYRAIHSSIYEKKNNIYTIVKWAGAAAAIVLLFFGVKLFYTENTLPQKDMIAKATEEKKINKNTTPNIQQISLPDGTLVFLSPGSEIKYDIEYNMAKRDVYLEGKAEFDVAPDKEKPFTVFCGKISTQALGTRFEVNGFSKNPSVKLFEGKVVVKNIENDKIKTYLEAGDKTAFISNKNIFETIFHLEDRIVFETQKKSERSKKMTVESHIEENTQSEEILVKKNNTNTENSSTYLRFENESLKSVINQLSQLYDVEINYPTEISSAINLYMSVDSRQPIEKILKNISITNGLEINKIDSNKYIISK